MTRQLRLLPELEDARVSAFVPRRVERETAMERRWRQRREEKQREAEQAERRVIGEIEHDERWCRPTGGQRVDVIRDERLT